VAGSFAAPSSEGAADATEASPGEGAAGGADTAKVAAPPGTVLGVDKKQGILIQTGDGIFAAERLQYHTKKALDWKAFLNGAKNFVGSCLG
jgi:methionyl-tRNA formyltransferase